MNLPSKQKAETETEKSTEARTEKKALKKGLLLVSLPLLGISLFMIVSAISIYIEGLSSLSYKRTEATVQSINQQFDALTVRKFALMTYRLQEKELKAQTAIPPGRVMKEGERCVIFYDKEHPEKIVLVQEIDYDPVILLGSFGFFILSFGILLGKRALGR